MLAAGIKDTSHCPRCAKMVPRADITRMLTDNGKAWVRCCIGCKELAHKRRAKAKNASK